MGLGAIAAILGLFLAFFLALAGVVWYPMKRLIRGKRNAIGTAGADADGHGNERDLGARDSGA
jgi:hypothetical protein